MSSNSAGGPAGQRYRKSVAERLRESEAQYLSIFEATSDGLIINDFATGLVAEVNPAFCSMHGYARDELIGAHPTTFIHPDSHHLFDAYMRTVQEGRSFQAPAVDLRKDGTPFPVEVHGALFTYQGKAHILGVVRDNTERMRAQEAAQEERQRLARELHDSVTQSLYSVTLYAEAASRLLESGRAETARAHLRDVQETAREALQEMRLLIFELRPPVLEQGLVTALRIRLGAVEERAGMRARLDADSDLRLPQPAEEALYRAALEALNNALKHARAHAVTVSLRGSGGRVVLEVTDDGAGFDPAARMDSGGVGLPGMRERVTLIGGRLEVCSRPGAGTTVRVEVPR